MANRTNPQRSIRLLPAGTVAADAADFTVPPEGIEMLLDQVTPRTVSCLFKIGVNTLWLRDESGGKAFFPDRSNVSFLFTPDVGISIHSLVVEGSPETHRSPPYIPSSESTSSSSANPPSLPGPSSAFSTRFVQQKKEGRCNVKIVQAEMVPSNDSNKKPSFNKLGQTFIDLTEATANIHYVTSVVQQKFGPDHVVVTGDGLKIEDSSGTQGLRFWKVGSRKLYAIKTPGIPSRRQKRKRDYISDDEADSADSPWDGVQTVLKEVKELRNDVENVLKLQEDSKLPPGLKLLMGDTFKCCICHGMITPPVAYTRCCRSIAGCEKCFDTFFGGEEGRSKCCPLCRKERAANEMSRVKWHGGVPNSNTGLFQ